ncbi:MAG TPA: glycosyltransferase family 9 protein [Oscillatoriaceae cyanobacterium]
MSRIPVSDRIQRILVVNFGGIGDEILFFPVIQSLREAYPKAHLTALVEPRCEGIMRFNPAVDDVVTFDAKRNPTVGGFLKLVAGLRARRFDLAITAGSSPVMALLVFLSGARWRVGYGTHRLRFLLNEAVPLNKQQYAAHMYHDLVGYLGKSPRPPQMTVPSVDREWARAFLSEAGVTREAPVVVLHPGVSRMSIEKNIIKGWAPERWVELGRRLAAAGMQVVLAGGPDDAEIIQLIRETGGFPAIEAYGKTQGLGQLAALIQEADVLVAVDSAPMHVGVAVGTPTVAIFGPTDPAKLVPPGTVHVAVVVENLACRPCLWDHRQSSCAELTCLKQLAVEQVESAVHQILPARYRYGEKTSRETP